MSRRLAFVLILALHAFSACAPTHAGARDAAASREEAKELWQRNMRVVDESVDFWKKQTGTALYTPKEYQAYEHPSTTNASWLERFLSVDPTWSSSDLVRPQSWNRYSCGLVKDLLRILF